MMVEAVVCADGSVRWTNLGADITGVTHNWSSLDALAADYWRYHRLTGRAKAEDDMAAWECVTDLMEEPSPRWPDVLHALVTAASRDEVGMVGVHCIEDLLSYHGDDETIVGEIEQWARRDPLARCAVQGMWLSGDLTPGVAERLRRLGAH